ncbi:MAG: hypothetical protein K2O14_03045 [Oscillospiraceae bacterium]|nr:hypothetical protein [Oscillospiraceae bacterium]
MGFVLTVGDLSEGLIGGIFPVCGMISAEHVGTVDAADCAVILRENSPGISIKNALGVIFNGDTPPEALPDGVQLISVGIGAKNTVSISSRAADSITLSLNRTIRTENGVCEPLELPVPAAENADVYDYMSAFAASLLVNSE